LKKQVTYAISKGWATLSGQMIRIHVTVTGNYGFTIDVKDPASVMFELREARKSCAAGYIRVNAFDATVLKVVLCLSS
jgi:ribulose bisphosphate carboxylase small subunit